MPTTITLPFNPARQPKTMYKTAAIAHFQTRLSMIYDINDHQIAYAIKRDMLYMWDPEASYCMANSSLAMLASRYCNDKAQTTQHWQDMHELFLIAVTQPLELSISKSTLCASHAYI